MRRFAAIGPYILFCGGTALAEAPPAPYSLPWQLRPAAVATLIRSDTSIAGHESGGQGGLTLATTLLGSYKLLPELCAIVRIGVVETSPPGGTSSAAFVNPILGGLYLLKPTAELRVALFLGFALPLGMGGGNTPDPGAAAAAKAGVLARSAMDNAMFAVDYFTVFPGVGIAWVSGGITFQAEATLLQLIRVRGDEVQPDAARTNFTAGVHLGYFVLPMLSFGTELRLQYWLSTPTSVARTPSTRDQLSFAVGPRLHFQLQDKLWFRPGIAYARGIDGAMSSQDYNIVQIDLPLSF